VVGKEGSVRRESFAEGVLDFPQYTRPREFRGLKVPDVLFSGDHARIEAWRRRTALEKTRRMRPDLFARLELSPKDRRMLEDIFEEKERTMSLMQVTEDKAMKKDLPAFRVGDTVKVHVIIKEGDKERVQIFQGDVIGKKGRGMSETFTVRKVSFGIGVERIFPRQSPWIKKVEVVRSGRVRRAKLYYLRGLKGKAAKLREDR
jgi:large subunit ribosomal protein L19